MIFIVNIYAIIIIIIELRFLMYDIEALIYSHYVTFSPKIISNCTKYS